MAVSSSREREGGVVHAVRFGGFEMDIKSGELRRNGSLVRLQPQPLKVLALLVDQPGEVVTREEIQSTVWAAGTFVDFEQSLNFSIRQIRSALGDSAVHPRYVETLPRRGCRWVGGSVERALPPATVHDWPRPVSENESNQNGGPGPEAQLISASPRTPGEARDLEPLAGKTVLPRAVPAMGASPERLLAWLDVSKVAVGTDASRDRRSGPSWPGPALTSSGAREAVGRRGARERSASSSSIVSRTNPVC